MGTGRDLANAAPVEAVIDRRARRHHNGPARDRRDHRNDRPRPAARPRLGRYVPRERRGEGLDRDAADRADAVPRLRPARARLRLLALGVPPAERPRSGIPVNGERAQALVEFALVLPVLLVLALAIAE